MDTIIILDKDEKQIGYIPDNVEWSIDGRTFRFGTQELDLAEVYLRKDDHHSDIRNAAEEIRKLDIKEEMLQKEYITTFESIKNNLQKFHWNVKFNRDKLDKEKYPLIFKLECNKIQYGDMWNPTELLFLKQHWYCLFQLKSIGSYYRFHRDDLPLLKEVLNLITEVK